VTSQPPGTRSSTWCSGQRARTDPARDHHPHHARAVQEVSNEDFVRTAEAKGMTRQVVTRRHILRNAMLPVITLIGLQTGCC
jgi:hypothetical protein